MSIPITCPSSRSPSYARRKQRTSSTRRPTVGNSTFTRGSAIGVTLRRLRNLGHGERAHALSCPQRRERLEHTTQEGQILARGGREVVGMPPERADLPARRHPPEARHDAARRQ